MNDGTTIELRPAAEWRRSVLYVDIGFLVLVALGVWYYIEGWAERDKLLLAIPVYGMPCLALNVFVLTSKIRVKRDGIHRRRWLVWDFWPWELFASGTLQRSGTGFVDPSRRFGFRSLITAFASGAERGLIVDQMERLIPLPVVKSKEHYELPLPFFRKLLIDLDGIQIQRRNMPLFSCPWSDVREIEIRRASHGRSDFRRLRMSVENWAEPIEITNRDACLGFLVPEEILQLISRHVPDDKWLIVADRDHRTIAEVERLIADCDRDVLDMRHLTLAVGAIVVIGVPAMILVDEKPLELVRALKILLWMGFMLTPWWFVLRFMRNEGIKRKKKLEQTRRTLLAAGVHS